MDYLLHRTPHEVAVIVAHEEISYGTILEARQDLLVPLKRAIFLAVKSALEKCTSPVPDEPEIREPPEEGR